MLFRNSRVADPKHTEPIRGELYSSDELAAEAKKLAASQTIISGEVPDPALLVQFQANARFLQQAYFSVSSALRGGESLPPAEEWFLDNFHLITGQLHAIKNDLPKKFYFELPSLGSGPYRGYPRLYEMALDLIAHTDSRLDAEMLRKFVGSYQDVHALTTGELWAFAIVLRVGLIENLKRLIQLSYLERHARNDANRFAERLIAAGSPEEIDSLLEERSHDPRRIGGAFAVQLILRLRDEPPVHFAAIEWLYAQLSLSGIEPDEMIRRKHHDLAGAQVSVSNIIQSLRLLAGMDWSEFVEEVSFVDATLRKDPKGFYSKCDFATRDLYRHAVEQIAKHSARSETEVADSALQLALQVFALEPAAKQSHIGYYLIGKGRPDLEKLCAYTPDPRSRLRRLVRGRPWLFYQLPIALITFLLSAIAAAFVPGEKYGTGMHLLAAALCMVPASTLGILFVNWVVTLFVKPKILPKLDFKEGIPEEFQSIVILPTLLTHSGEGRELASRLEVLYLANSDDALDFALLTDFVDGDTATTESDRPLLSEASDAIRALNVKYPRAFGSRFHLFHRHRTWNPQEGKWMGWERKRGKLEEFNRLLRGDLGTTFGSVDAPAGVRFVITLDRDSVLPRDAARRLIGTMAHPLNRPVYDPLTGHIVDGYAILQPRVSSALVSSNRSWFSRIFSGYAGIDPYTTAVSDIYQDLFEEGSFVGKGLYDLDAFQAAVGKRFPENALLSHDLIEGSFARTAIATDVEIFDDHPSTYVSHMLRLHRWVRGDWQIGRWLLRTVPWGDGRMVRNTLSWLGRWKLLDNLRRSLVSPALFVMLLCGWVFFPEASVFWSAITAAVVFAPLVIQFISGMVSSAPDVRWIGKIWGLGYDAALNALQGLLQLSFLANNAWVMSDAILRTLWRLLRRRNLLEWVTAAQAERSHGSDLAGYVIRMYGSILLAFLASVLILLVQPGSFSAAAPILLLWFLAPAGAYATAHLTPRRELQIPNADVPFLRSCARDMWRYFETFANEENHWLPPDNLQETPAPALAHRTSPTNIAFLLLSNIAAYDFGYIGAVEFSLRTERTLETLTKFKTFNGHFFNWYDTKTLEPLEPRYVSTVDSGNLAAALIVLKQFSSRLALNKKKLLEPRSERFEGVCDTFDKFFSALKRSHEILSGQSEALAGIRSILNSRALDSKDPVKLLSDLASEMEPLTLPQEVDPETAFWLDACKRTVASHLSDYASPQDIPRRLLAISREAEEFEQEIDFRFLYNEQRGIFSIGFNVTSGHLDPSAYDLFASEARLASFVAISKSEVPQSHWFRMARPITSIGRRRILTSWSGSMFEYLMPLLFLRNEENTLLDVTYRGVVDLQRVYGMEHQVPWGISEAAYNFRDLSMNYQYGPFGVPDLGLKRGLSRDLVIAPYATFLAMMVRPVSAIHNLQHLEKMGARGKYGFFESIDFTKDRLQDGEKYAVVKTFMSHHTGMSLIALDNLLHRNAIQHCFHADPAVEATAVLLQEKMPLAVRSAPFHIVDERPELMRILEPSVAREFHNPNLTPPRTQIISNGNFLSMITTAGAGYSECKGIRLGRWREDTTRDNWGSFFYIKDRESDEFWSAGFQPTLKTPDRYHVVYAEDKVEIRRTDGGIETEMDVTISPEDNAEIRRITLVNTGDRVRHFDITSYMEVTLSSAANDMAHPAFLNLFVETEQEATTGALLASRRPRSSDEPVYWAGQVMMHEDALPDLQYETDRSRFIGRNRSIVTPHAMEASLSNTAGAVLDPIFSLRGTIELEPFSRKTVAFTTMMANSRDEIVALAEKYRSARGVLRAFELAAAHAQVTLRQLSISLQEAHLFQRIAGRFIYTDPSLRPSPAVLARNTRSQSALWPYGISGDLPICLVRIEDQSEIEIVRQLLRAHDYWRGKGIVVDLVILNEYPSSYFQDLQDEIQSVIRNSLAHVLMDKPGGIFLRRADLMPEEDRILLRSAARVVIIAQRGSLARQASRVESRDPLPPLHLPEAKFPIIDPPLSIPVPQMTFHNGYGGFTLDGKEYVIAIHKGTTTPAPWINVISNSDFGFQISESGAGMTWAVNSSENRLTPWSNDAVVDPHDSVIYVRDEESGSFWSATPQPAPAPGDYVVAHGTGYTRFNSGGYGIDQELLMFVDADSPVKIMKLRLRNTTRRTRKLSVTCFMDLVLGVTRSRSAPFVITSIDARTGAVFATNPYNNEFAGRLAFLWMNDRERTVTADRTFFLGPNGTLANPAAMSYAHLAGKVGAGLDPCAAVQGMVRLAPLSEHTVIFLFGETANAEHAREIVSRLSTAESVEYAYEKVYNRWEKSLSAVQVKTPEPAMDILLNRWFPYQTYACRFMARSAFYQGSGAYGFRDQLQDVMALVYSEPQVMRRHLLLAASRQFLEGDVQHWWHPPTGRGVRTRISDDLLWLPYCTAHYVRVTGDREVLNESAPYLQGPVLEPDQMESYFEPKVAGTSGTLYEHCIKAIEYSLKYGSHHLPLMGAGDWNDGMNRLGFHGKGESVWLAWFLLAVLKEFAEICDLRYDSTHSTVFRRHASGIAAAVKEHAWDGEWFVRGFDDEGAPFGSSANHECRIDSIAQSWAVLSRSENDERGSIALQSVERLLLDRNEQLAMLLTPPFLHTLRDPGYIKGYLAGIRENGGHYTHAAAWLIAAFAELGQPEKALEIFQMCSPLQHSRDPAAAEKYKLEPYVAAGDIYTHPSHRGRGGWSWYTGSSAWLYRAALEWILGFRLEGNLLRMTPCIPQDWPGFEITYRFGSATYHIQVIGGSKDMAENTMTLIDDGVEHKIVITSKQPVN